MSSMKEKKYMYYLQNDDGQIVRALHWTEGHLIFIFRHDNQRIEVVDSTDLLDQEKIPYEVIKKFSANEQGSNGLDKIDKKTSITNSGPKLYLVPKSREDGEEDGNSGSSYKIDRDLPPSEKDDEDFVIIFKKTAVAGGVVGLVLMAITLIFSKSGFRKDELQVVQVMDRKEVEKMITPPPPTPPPQPLLAKPVPVVTQKVIPPVVPPKKVVQNKEKVVVPKVKKIAYQPQPVQRPTPIKRKYKEVPTVSDIGIQSALGSLKKFQSKQRGGLNVDAIDTSAGIGLGGGQGGSGGTQTATYSKGLFSNPLGAGHNAQGGGGYGTRGKGGGRAGYGDISLTGSSQSYFSPLDDEADVAAGLSLGEVAAVIQRHHSEIRFCYEQGLQKRPSLSGRFSMKFLIGPRGSVTLARVDNSSLNSSIVENCVASKLRNFQFPKPQGGVTVKVNYPFAFRRTGES